MTDVAQAELKVPAGRAKKRRLRPYPAYKDSGVPWIGRVPDHWDACRTKFVARLESGHTPSRQHPEYWVDCTIPWFSLADVWQIRDGKTEYVNETAEKVSELGIANSSARLLPEGTVIVSRTASVGFSAILGVDAATTQDFVNWVCGSRIRPEYLLYVFRGMRQEFRRLTMGSTHQTIYMPDVGQFSTPVPPLQEQDAIVRYIRRETSRIDALVEKKQQLIELLREKRAAVIARVVIRGLQPDVPLKESGMEWLGKVPSHWSLKRLKHISPSLTVGVVVNPSAYYATEGVPFLFGSNLREEGFILDGVRRISTESNLMLAKSMLRAGDLVTVRVGFPGVTAVIPPELDGCNCASLMVVRGSDEFDSRWLCYALNSRIGRHQVEIVQYGAAQEQFNIAHAVEWVFPIPPRSEQTAMADYLDGATCSVNTLVNTIEQNVALLHEHRQALIAAAVTGQIDVREEVPR